MSELIDRNDLYRKIATSGDWTASEVLELKYLIYEQPIFDGRPTGTWVRYKMGYYKCSNCNRVSVSHPSYCCKCGAKMQKEGV